MKIEHQDNGINGRFYIEKTGVTLAEMTYVYSEKEIIDINHTEVSPTLKGQGIGYQLMDALIEFMRENHLKAMPSCSYAKAVFKKKTAYSDRLA